MTEGASTHPTLPSTEMIARAVSLYLDRAYGQDPPASVAGRFTPPPEEDLADWLMSDVAERDPKDSDIDSVRSFALRIGNAGYPHMKVRLSRPPNDNEFVFSVDAHDACLKCPADQADHEALEQIKRYNTSVVVEVTAAWETAGVPTERSYLRRKIEEARQARSGLDKAK